MIVTKLRKIYGSINGLTIGVLGLTYKPGTSTLRRSASLEIIHEIVEEGAKVKVYDPKADLHEIRDSIEFEFCLDIVTAAKDTDALIFVTAWPEFREIDFSKIKSIVKRPVVIDAQNMLDSENMVRLGFAYFGVGRL
jgi:UDPglucose 6-dehydrogenase